MTNVDRSLAEALELSDGERATLADRLFEVVKRHPRFERWSNVIAIPHESHP